MEELVRPRFRRRRRWATAAIAGAIAAHGAAFIVLVTRPAPQPTYITRVEHTTSTRVVPVPTPMIIPTPMQLPSSAAAPTSCPPPRTDAPRLTPPELPETITQLAVSPTNAGWIAAYNEKQIYASTDAGRTFTQVLDGPGTVTSVAFDCFGNVIAARGDKIGVREGAREKWLPVPGLAIGDENRVALIGGGRDIIAVGQLVDGHGARIAISRDRSAGWQYHDIADVYMTDGVAGVQRADGSILVGIAVPDCMTEDLYWARIENGIVTRATLSLPGSIQWQFWGDRIYAGNSWRAQDAPDDAEWHPLRADAWATPVPGPRPVFVGDRVAYKLAGGKLTPLPWIVDGELGTIAMDPAGRIWSVRCGQPWIATTTEREPAACQ